MKMKLIKRQILDEREEQLVNIILESLSKWQKKRFEKYLEELEKEG